jgi:glycosyltransferase involved in cell wall biosynthesis
VKVLHVEAGTNLYGGARQVQYLLEGLGERGVESILVCPKVCALADAMKGRIGRICRVPMSGDLDLPFIWRLKSIIGRERPDVVHLHSRRGADVLGGIAARRMGVKTVLSRRVDNPESRLLVRWKYGLYDRVITISEGIRQVLLEEGVAPEKVVCVRSAVDMAPYQSGCDRQWFRESFGLEEDAITLGVIAQLIPRKGHRFLLDAMPRLLADFPGVRLLLFGKGAQEAEIRSRAERLGIGDKVMLVGFRDDLPKILPCLDLVVHPALMEGLGVSLLQAASAGRPVVASHAGGMPEAVRDGENGLLVPPGDSDALAEAILRLLSDPPLAQRMGEAGRSLMAQEFSVTHMVEGNLAVYRSLLDQADG